MKSNPLSSPTTPRKVEINATRQPTNRSVTLGVIPTPTYLTLSPPSPTQVAFEQGMSPVVKKDVEESKCSHNVLTRSASELVQSISSTSPMKPEVARDIMQGEAGITNARSKQHILGSYGASTCVILAIYNKKTQTAALAHVYDGNDLASVIGMMIYQINKDNSDVLLDVHLASGNLSESNETLGGLKTLIRYQQKKLAIRSETCSQSLAIDAVDGKTYTSVNPSQLDPGKDLDKRIETCYRNCMFPLQKYFLDIVLFPDNQ